MLPSAGYAAISTLRQKQDWIKNLKAVAVIPAGGQGRRFGSQSPKQYVEVAGVPLLVHTLRKFDPAGGSGVGGLIIPVPSADVDFVKEEIVSRYGIRGVLAVLAGGRERQDSVRAGLAAVPSDVEIVAVHDAVRPFVGVEMIRKVIDEAAIASAATLGVPVKDTVKRVDGGSSVVGTVDRDGLWLTQTPQAFRREIIAEAYKRAYEDGVYATDDASLVERIGVQVKMVMGSYGNIKITTAEDFHFAQFLMEQEGNR
jgi:2-C-methyl-D-erythritol 4-phosphate cytidylyltransferase